ncbi:hypothetical protein HPP92_029122 [Vanilla planifolia]|uniref:Uncharacterized protein n=1 Tax=Vanilla planifolia TaxID=51239 RepID=A0A835P6M7_VANPL|nr:hypothetical protein HPP92_029122 [Vanilla planifolia]KAG0445878.1 hypothetical protein HPP92_029110 [Vanilla planifolia]
MNSHAVLLPLWEERLTTLQVDDSYRSSPSLLHHRPLFPLPDISGSAGNWRLFPVMNNDTVMINDCWNALFSGRRRRYNSEEEAACDFTKQRCLSLLRSSGIGCRWLAAGLLQFVLDLISIVGLLAIANFMKEDCLAFLFPGKLVFLMTIFAPSLGLIKILEGIWDHKKKKNGIRVIS